MSDYGIVLFTSDHSQRSNNISVKKNHSKLFGSTGVLSRSISRSMPLTS